MALRITGHADLDVFYEADAARYRARREEVTRRVTRQAFMAFFAGCPSIGFERDGRPIGGVIYDGRAAHIAVLEQHHGQWAWLLKPALHWLFSMTDEIVVEIEADNDKALHFMDRNQWERLKADSRSVVYRMKLHGGQRKTDHPWTPRRRG